MGLPQTHFVFLLLLLLLCCTQLVPLDAAGGHKKLYIVYMGEKQHEDPNHVTASHHATLESILGSKESALESIVYSYKHGFSGFSALLTDSEAKKIAEMPGVLHVTPSRELKLQTTRSWDFLGMNYNNPTKLLRKSKFGENMIIGIVDSGIWPESRSFRDSGYGPVPSRWKGMCQSGQAFNLSNCNRKIIGARWYAGGVDRKFLREQGEFMSARDRNGHGTLMASTAAGSVVEDVSFHGLAAGTARGGAPRARLAMYKVLWGGSVATGTEASILAAIDDAIHDGVDVLSLSLGTPTVSFGSLHAVDKGITVVYAGGNTGPVAGVVLNVAPWVITVAASTIDRAYPTTIALDNGQTFVGQAHYYESTKKSNGFRELVHGARCDIASLNTTNISGKVVLCDGGNALANPPLTQLITAMSTVLTYGGKGIIFAHFTTNIIDLREQICQVLIQCKDLIPVIFVDFEVGTQILKYIDFVNVTSSSSNTPNVKINPTRTVVGKHVLSPKVASFSSRGPNALLPAILKPDIAAPGASILAAERDFYRVASGTSMSTPHISAIASLLKSLHPSWSPAMIKSAIMTTASINDAYGFPIIAEGVSKKIADPFDFGSGHVNPNKAMDPGLVYDIDTKDYHRIMHCMPGLQTIICNLTEPVYNLNLPSVVIPNIKNNVVVQRAVTNVGKENDVYDLDFQSPPGVKMDVNPKKLIFSVDVKKLSFEITFSVVRKMQGSYTFGSLTWYNQEHIVRIPVVARIVVEDFYADVA